MQRGGKTTRCRQQAARVTGGMIGGWLTCPMLAGPWPFMSGSGADTVEKWTLWPSPLVLWAAMSPCRCGCAQESCCRVSNNEHVCCSAADSEVANTSGLRPAVHDEQSAAHDVYVHGQALLNHHAIHGVRCGTMLIHRSKLSAVWGSHACRMACMHTYADPCLAFTGGAQICTHCALHSPEAVSLARATVRTVLQLFWGCWTLCAKGQAPQGCSVAVSGLALSRLQ